MLWNFSFYFVVLISYKSDIEQITYSNERINTKDTGSLRTGSIDSYAQITSVAGSTNCSMNVNFSLYLDEYEWSNPDIILEITSDLSEWVVAKHLGPSQYVSNGPGGSPRSLTINVGNPYVNQVTPGAYVYFRIKLNSNSPAHPNYTSSLASKQTNNPMCNNLPAPLGTCKSYLLTAEGTDQTSMPEDYQLEFRNCNGVLSTVVGYSSSGVYDAQKNSVRIIRGYWSIVEQ